ncbi:MAG: 4Fe-4S dicluster domain-containing protein [Anaerovoracaceae bacterium]
MSKLTIHPNSCKACGYCVVNCPKSAVELEGLINEGGYQTPVVDEEKCITCGICFNVCPDYVYEIIE